MDLLLHIITFILLMAGLTVAAFLNACLSYFLDFCFNEGNIFQGWFPFLKRTLKGGENNFWFKPLGWCVICSNIWQGLITYPVAVWVLGLCSLPFLSIVFLGVSYLLISNFLIRKMI